MEEHNVFSIALDEGKIIVAYDVRPVDKPVESCTICRSDVPHDDFKKLIIEARNLAKRLLEIDVNPFVYRMTAIRFFEHKERHLGVRFSGEITGLEYSADTIRINTPKYYEVADEFGLGLLDHKEAEMLRALKEEAFLYAYMNKRTQPTIEEAQRAYENGGKFDDEL